MIKDKVAFLGPQGTFSHEAASLVSDNLVSYCSIQSVMSAVESGECVCGVVPIENSIEGPVSLTLDSLIHNFDLTILLIEHDMKLVGGICEELTVLNFGQVLTQGKTEEVLKDPVVITAYLGE